MINQRRVHPESGQHVAHELRGSHVVIALRDDVIAGLDQRQHGTRHGRHSGGDQQRRLGALKAGDDRLGACLRRAAIAGIEARVARLLRHCAKRFRTVRAIGSARVDRGRHGSVAIHAGIGVNKLGER